MKEQHDESIKNLIIPFVVKAYLTGNEYTDTYKAPRWSPDYTKIYSSALGASISPAAFTEYGYCLKAGVHLHFILPDAFTHGKVKDNSYFFPMVPNRYAVTRLYRDHDKIQVKCMIVESDFLTGKVSAGENAGDYTVIPYLDGTGRPYRFMGRSYEAGTVPAPGDYLPELTALGGGDPMFAAYYPTCRSVFGWYDDLKGVPVPSDLTYFVVGYFSDRKNDPFSKAGSREEFSAILTENGFSAEEGTDYGNGCVLFGQALNIRWEGPGHHYDDMDPPTGTVEVSFGRTSAEAMAAVLGQHYLENAGNTADLEYQLIQLQYDLLDQEKQPDGNFKVDDEIFSRTFRSFAPLEEYDELQLTNQQADAAGDFAGYRQLRCLQREAGRLNRELHFMREKLYRAWETYINRNEAHDPGAKTALAETERLLGLMASPDGPLAQANIKNNEVVQKRAEVTAGLPAGYQMITKTAESFAVPKEPVLMLSGDGIFRSCLFGEDTKDGMLYCQMSPQKSAELPWTAVAAQCEGLPSGDFLADYLPLFYQAVLNSPQLMGLSDPHDRHPYHVEGKISPIAINTSPLELAQLFMDWQIDYYYTADTATLAGWTFDHGETGYSFKGLQDGRLASVSGRVPLTPHALYNLTAQLDGNTKEFPGVYDKVRNLPFISQELSGFTGELTGLRQAFQLPVTYDTKAISAQVAEHVTDERLSVSGSALYPMRGGFIALSRLNLTGTFGQKQNLAKNSIYNRAKAFFPYYMPTSADRTKGMFPLAFSSPARITAEFVCQKDGVSVSTCDPESSPVCAVILPELLNRRLVLYDENGLYAGMLKTVYRAGERKTLFIKAADAPEPNPVLNGFIDGIRENPHALPEMIDLLQDTLDKTVRVCESAFIWGVPLVLARLRLRLEFFGEAEYSKTWQDFATYDDKGAKALKIPLKFGNLLRVTDGTAGVFEDGDYSCFHALWGVPESRYPNYVTTHSPTVCANDGNRYFTALLAPNSDMVIESGLLPAIKLRLDAAHTALTDKVVPTAEINPVIVNIEKVRLPTAASEFRWRYKREIDGNISGDVEEDVLPLSDVLAETAVVDGYLVKRSGSNHGK